MNQVDPMAAKFASLTPYNYSFNDPVSFTDPSGMDPWDGVYGGNSAYYYAMQGQDGMSPGQEALMDPFGSAWNPATAGGYQINGQGIYSEASISGWFTSFQTSNVWRDAGRMSPYAFAATHGTGFGGGLGGLLGAVSSVDPDLDWYLVYGTHDLAKTNVSMYLYFDRSFHKEYECRDCWLGSYYKANGAARFQGKDGVQDYVALAKHLISNFADQLSNNKPYSQWMQLSWEAMTVKLAILVLTFR
jgi:hypothetical protein